jgi:hypothetical protein
MPSVTINLTRLDYALGVFRMSSRHPVNLFVFGVAFLWLAVEQWMKMNRGKDSVVIAIVIIVAFLMVVVLYVFAVSVTVLGMALIARGEGGVLGEHTYRFVDAGLMQSTSIHETLMKWGGVRSVVRTPRYIYVRVNRISFHIIPRRHFLEAAADEQFWNALQPLVAKKVS